MFVQYQQSINKMPQIPSTQYYLDIANSTIFQTPINFTSKYPSLQHYQQILDDQLKIQNILYRMIKQQQSGDGLDVPLIIKEAGYDQTTQNIILQVLKIKYNQYKAEIVKKEIFQGGVFMANFNWKIKNVVGCSQFTHKNRIILKLELTLASGKKYDEAEIISLELGVTEAREFLNKLKKINKELKGTFY